MLFPSGILAFVVLGNQEPCESVTDSPLALHSVVPYTPAIRFSWRAVHTGRLRSEDLLFFPPDPICDPDRSYSYCMLSRPQCAQAEILSQRPALLREGQVSRSRDRVRHRSQDRSKLCRGPLPT